MLEPQINRRITLQALEGEGEVGDFVDVSKRPTAIPTCTRSISRCQGFPKARV